ncbi:hypothetical protein [Sorangium sp. So ce693]|uniref:hypothetical protein n=1 Tax=Sorangium sp. So ce693 TaxID=3133318 RepID=UPI003F617CD4
MRECSWGARLSAGALVGAGRAAVARLDESARLHLEEALPARSFAAIRSRVVQEHRALLLTSVC